MSDLTAQSLDKKDLFSESDPFYCVYRTNDDETRTLVYRSEWIRNTASPDWAPVTMDCAKVGVKSISNSISKSIISISKSII